MEILVKKTSEENVVIDLPYYCKGSCFAYSILDEERAVQVCYGIESGISIGLVHKELPFSISGVVNDPCTKEEFESIYNEASLKLLNRSQTITQIIPIS